MPAQRAPLGRRCASRRAPTTAAAGAAAPPQRAASLPPVADRDAAPKPRARPRRAGAGTPACSRAAVAQCRMRRRRRARCAPARRADPRRPRRRAAPRRGRSGSERWRRLCGAGLLAAQRGRRAGRLPRLQAKYPSQLGSRAADDPARRSRRQGHLLPRHGRARSRSGSEASRALQQPESGRRQCIVQKN